MSVYTEKINRVILPAIALRGLVAFPGIDTSFEVSRPASVKAVEMALQADSRVFLVMQKDVRNENPEEKDLFRVGTIARIKQSVRLPDHTFRVIVSGKSRAQMQNLSVLPSGARTCEVLEKELWDNDALTAEAVRRCVLDAVSLLTPHLPRVSPETAQSLESIRNAELLTDFVAANFLRRGEDKQKVLEAFDLKTRGEVLAAILASETSVAVLEEELGKKVQERLDRHQREYYLKEQLRVIQNELTGADGPIEEFPEDTEEEDDLLRRITERNLPEPWNTKLRQQVAKMRRMPFGSSEAALIGNYVETCLDIPVGQMSRDTVDLEKARKILDEDHEGLEKVKERVLEFLAASKLRGALQGQILCLVGAPGVGKTSVAASIARALGKNYVRVSLGGVRDEADIRGHRKTYIGAMPGRIIAALTQAKTMNPLITLDEIDKLTRDSHGDPASALLEVLDSEQNKAFRDHFVELPVDLSSCMFIATANETDSIPPALFDRMEIIHINGYTESEKIAIARRHLIKKQMERHGLTAKNLTVTDGALRRVIRSYTREQGVRNLEREISRICRKAAKNVVDGQNKTSVTTRNVPDFLGKEKFLRDSEERNDRVGVVNGLAWTMSGGEMLEVEAVAVPGAGKLELTGSLGDVMKESAHAALSYIRANSAALGVKNAEFYKNTDLHIHLPEGAIPKDGPSAGVTLVTCLASLLTGKAARGDVAMTGEITLHGEVLPIGGLREKTSAALRAGIREIYYPAKNRKDLDEVDPMAIEKMKFIPCRTVEDILKNVLVDPR